MPSMDKAVIESAIKHAGTTNGHQAISTPGPGQGQGPDQASPLPSSIVSEARIIGAIRTVLEELGLDANSEHLLDTPRRVAATLREFCQPNVDLKALLKSGFENGHQEDTGAMVVQVDIPVRALCPHHLLPLVGTCDISYIPKARICGLSKLARVAQAAATLQPTTQESFTNLIADTLQDGLDAVGVYVITSMAHMCMAARGVQTPQSRTRVSAIRGIFVHAAPTRSEALELMRSPR